MQIEARRRLSSGRPGCSVWYASQSISRFGCWAVWRIWILSSWLSKPNSLLVLSMPLVCPGCASALFSARDAAEGKYFSGLGAVVGNTGLKPPWLSSTRQTCQWLSETLSCSTWVCCEPSPVLGIRCMCATSSNKSGVIDSSVFPENLKRSDFCSVCSW